MRIMEPQCDSGGTSSTGKPWFILLHAQDRAERIAGSKKPSEARRSNRRDMEVPKHVGPKNKPKYTMILAIGTPKMELLNKPRGAVQPRFFAKAPQVPSGFLDHLSVFMEDQSLCYQGSRANQS